MIGESGGDETHTHDEEDVPEPLSKKDVERFSTVGLGLIKDYGDEDTVVFSLKDGRKLHIHNPNQEKRDLQVSLIKPEVKIVIDERIEEIATDQAVWTTYSYYPDAQLDKAIKKVVDLDDDYKPPTSEWIERRKLYRAKSEVENEIDVLEEALEAVDEEDLRGRLHDKHASALPRSVAEGPLADEMREYFEAEKVLKDRQELREVIEIMKSVDPKTQLLYPEYKPPEEVA